VREGEVRAHVPEPRQPGDARRMPFQLAEKGIAEDVEIRSKPACSKNSFSKIFGEEVHQVVLILVCGLRLSGQGVDPGAAAAEAAAGAFVTFDVPGAVKGTRSLRHQQRRCRDGLLHRRN
jgi:hypothetical protein